MIAGDRIWCICESLEIWCPGDIDIDFLQTCCRLGLYTVRSVLSKAIICSYYLTPGVYTLETPIYLELKVKYLGKILSLQHLI